MRLNKITLASLISATVKALLLGSVAITISVSPALQSSAQADPLDKSSPKIAHGRYKYLSQLSSGTWCYCCKSSPKIAHGMYRDRGKSSPKIAHGMYRDRGKSSPKIAEGMYRDRGKSSPKIAHGMNQVDRNELRDEIDFAIETGRLKLADELLYELNHLN
ncbi:MAG: hypothetical protein ABGX05_14945, partial [Pirellulaceae bacterium]